MVANSSVSTNASSYLTHSAKTFVIAGATAGVTLGLFRGVVSVRRHQPADGYEIASECLTQAGTGAVLGVMGATVAAVSGVCAATIAGRGVLTITAPIIASALVTSTAHEHVLPIVRDFSEDLVSGLKRALASAPSPHATLKLPPP